MRQLKAMALLATLALGGLAASQVAPPTPPGPRRSHARDDHESNDPEAEARSRVVNDLNAQGERAEARGDLRSAEGFYLRSINAEPRPFAHVSLARLYDRMGRDREACAEYRTVVVGDRHSFSSHQRAPRILTRFGDLAARLGTVDEARRAYTIAAAAARQDDYWAPLTTPRDASLASLKAAARTAAALLLRGTHNADAVKELKLASSFDPHYWVPHFYLAETLNWTNRDEAYRKAETAVRLAPSAKYREMVERMRKSEGLVPDSSL